MDESVKRWAAMGKTALVVEIIQGKTMAQRLFAKKVYDWITSMDPKTAYIELGSSWESGHCESLNTRYRDELMNGEIFNS